MKLREMCDPKELDRAINDGLVACRQCRDAPLAIHNEDVA